MSDQVASWTSREITAVRALVLELAEGQPPVQRHEDGTQTHAGVLQGEDLRVTVGDQPDPIPTLDPELVAQHAGEVTDEPIELLPREAMAGVPVGQRELVGTNLPVVPRDVTDGELHG